MADQRTGSSAKKSGHGKTARTTTTAGNQPSSSKDTVNNIAVNRVEGLKTTTTTTTKTSDQSSSSNDTVNNIAVHRAEGLGTTGIVTTTADDQPASLNNTKNTIAMHCVAGLGNNLTSVNHLENNLLDMNPRLSILENEITSKQKTLAVLKERLALYAKIVQKLQQRLQQRSGGVSNKLTNTTKITEKEFRVSSLATSAEVDVRGKKQKTLHETQTEYIRTATDIRHTRLRRTITWGTAGLRNQSVICYSNAIFQAIASCNHLTTIFQNVLTDNQRCFRMNYEFIRLVNSMTTQSECIDPGNFVRLFTDYYTEFRDEECTYHGRLITMDTDVY